MGEAERRKRAIEAANAFAKVYQKWSEVPGPVRGRVTICSVAHDEGCPAAGTGVGCTCTPAIRRFLAPDDPAQEEK
jgi:hypothetical protein